MYFLFVCILQDTFRRLSQQLKDVDQHFSGKYHNSGFKVSQSRIQYFSIIKCKEKTTGATTVQTVIKELYMQQM